MMRVFVLGVGGAFTDRFYHTNYLVELPGCRLLVDAGATLRYSLPAAGYTVQDVQAVAVSHFHSDHAGGLEELAQRSHYLYQHRPRLYVMPDQAPLYNSLFALHGVKPERYFAVTAMPLDSVVLQETQQAQYRLEFYSTRGLHADVTSNYSIGVSRSRPGHSVTRVVFSGDLGCIGRSPLGGLAADTETAAIFHDCYTGAAPSPAHTGLEQMTEAYRPELRPKIQAIHYGDNIDAYSPQIRAAGFSIARQGASYIF